MWPPGRRAAVLAAVALAAVAFLPASPVAGQGDASRLGDPLPVLDVPFVAQSEALCGAAALSMVFRYWGERGVRIEDFSHLLSPDGRGIPTDRLVAEAGRRGWSPLVFRGDRADLRRQVERGRPVVALLEVAPERYHYVVVVASWENGAAFHDPARAPWRVESAAAFDRAWEGAGRWAMVLLPEREAPATRKAPATREAPAGSEAERPAGSVPASTGIRERAAGPRSGAEAVRSASPAGCGPAVEAAVRLVRSGRLEEAEALLLGAAATCPQQAGPARELAGLRLRQGRYEAAERLAETAVGRDPRDGHALRTLATSRYLEGDAAGALAAWTRAGEASLDLVRISGLRRTRHRPVARLMGLEAGRPLTPDGLGTARRRLASLPAASATRLEYRPVGEGAVELRAAVLERPLVPTSPAGLTALALRAATTGELAVTAAGATGAGEAWSLAWRPSTVRPRLELGLAIPARLGFPGVWRLSGSWERERWARPSEGGVAGDGSPDPEGTRRRLAASAESWAAPWLRWGGGLAIERWSGEGARLAASGELETRDPSDRLAGRLALTAWRGTVEGGGTGRLEAGLRWRSRPPARGTVLALRGDLSLVSSDAPRFLWPGAGTGRGRPVPLRAHPLLRDGIVTGPAFGPALAAASGEVVRWIRVPGLPAGAPVRMGVAGFADAARAWRPDASPPFLLDVGLGLRLAPGDGGRLRIDLGRGVADGAAALSAAWEAPWPGF